MAAVTVASPRCFPQALSLMLEVGGDGAGVMVQTHFMDDDNPFTPLTLERLPEPTSNPALALTRAAHLVFEVSRLGVLTANREINHWAADVARAQMKALDPVWSDSLDGLARQARMTLYVEQKFKAGSRALGEAGIRGYKAILDSTFERLEALAGQVHELRGDQPGVRLAAMVATVPLPIFCYEWRDAVVKAAFDGDSGVPPDYKFNIALAEFRVMDQLWAKADVIVARTLIGNQDVHQWVRDGALDVQMDGRTKTVCLGQVCSMTGARWLLPGDRIHERDRVSLRNGRLVFSLMGPPAIIDQDRGVVRPLASSVEGGADVVGYSIWASRTSPFNPEVQFQSERWGRRQANSPVEVRPLLEEVLRDLAGNPILYRNLAAVVRRPGGDASRREDVAEPLA